MASQRLVGSQVQRNRLRQFIKQFPEIVGSETTDLASRVYENAVNRAPKQSGDLRSGILVTNTSRGSFKISVHAYNKRTGYDYGPIQHNNPNYFHPVGEYLFITKAMHEELDTFETRVIRRMRNI